jgi:hypothetical protein
MLGRMYQIQCCNCSLAPLDLLFPFHLPTPPHIANEKQKVTTGTQGRHRLRKYRDQTLSVILTDLQEAGQTNSVQST